MKVEIELDDLNELKDEVESLKRELGNQTYMGNSISYIYQKMINYKTYVHKLHDELIEKGYAKYGKEGFELI